jgi:hypothetical protein
LTFGWKPPWPHNSCILHVPVKPTSRGPSEVCC